MTVGSMVWGWIASHHSIPVALLVAAIGMVVCNLLTYLFISGQNMIVDDRPSHFLPIPLVADQPSYEEGPVMITVEFCVKKENVDKFTLAIHDLRRIRLRDGAFYWSLLKNVENPKKFVECFMAESWLEHLRQHERFTVSDQKILEKVGAFHEGKNPPRITHFVKHKLPERKGRRFKRLSIPQEGEET